MVEGFKEFFNEDIKIDTSRWEAVHGRKPMGKSFFHFIVNIDPDKFDRRLAQHRKQEVAFKGMWNNVSKQAVAAAKREGLLTISKPKLAKDAEDRKQVEFLKDIKIDKIYLVP